MCWGRRSAGVRGQGSGAIGEGSDLPLEVGEARAVVEAVGEQGGDDEEGGGEGEPVEEARRLGLGDRGALGQRWGAWGVEGAGAEGGVDAAEHGFALAAVDGRVEAAAEAAEQDERVDPEDPRGIGGGGGWVDEERGMGGEEALVEALEEAITGGGDRLTDEALLEERRGAPGVGEGAGAAEGELVEQGGEGEAEVGDVGGGVAGAAALVVEHDRGEQALGLATALVGRGVVGRIGDPGGEGEGLAAAA
jgi:hypothetical protein